MKILFSSYAFAPSVGGIETVSAILADEFVKAGHEVQLVTDTQGPEMPALDYSLVRCPSLWMLLRLLRKCDVVFQNNISLRTLLPALLLRKPVVLVHQTWIQNVRGEIDWPARLKLALLPQITNVAISHAIARRLKVAAAVIGNPYRDALFRLDPESARDQDLIFVGRLVSDKGVDLLLRALHSLGQRRLRPNLTIVGGGPEEEMLRGLATELGCAAQVRFAGEKFGDELVKLLNRHRIMVVPSRWAEPFGVVALEGIACGCAVVGSADGGLKEAVGPCGLTFPNGNEEALAGALEKCLTNPSLEESFRAVASEHLARFKAKHVARLYLDLMERARA